MVEHRSPSPSLGSSPIAQLCFVTDDLEAAVAEFARLTGLTPGQVAIAAITERPTIYRGEARPVRARTCAFRLPNIDVEFLEPGPGPSVWRDSLNQRGPSLHHIAFRCDSLSDTTAAFGAQGLMSCQSADFVAGGGLYSVFDTAEKLGTMIEVFEIRSPSVPADQAERRSGNCRLLI